MELLKAFLPLLSVVTFVAGYLLSNLDRFRESRRKLRNLKMILFKKMSENYKTLNKLVPLDENALPDPTLVAVFAQRFSFAVYDRYLDRLDQLRTDDLSTVYEACVMLKGLQLDGTAFLAASRAADTNPKARTNLAAQATLVISVVGKCHELMKEALRVFAEGPSLLSAQEADRGSALAAYGQILPSLMQDKSDQKADR